MHLKIGSIQRKFKDVTETYQNVETIRWGARQVDSNPDVDKMYKIGSY